jgi:hypothetical protein
MNTMPMSYSDKTLEIAGGRIGLSPETVTEILVTARQNAQKFGMQVNQ